jgi:hypothetical protein
MKKIQQPEWEYRIAAHPTRYADVLFRSRLEARWAAFFDLMGWKWQYEPVDLEGWTPDFLISIPCYHSECSTHDLFVEVKPYREPAQFAGHALQQYAIPYAEVNAIGVGLNPWVSTTWETSHGSGGGIRKLDDCYEALGLFFFAERVDSKWTEAGNITRYHFS